MNLNRPKYFIIYAGSSPYIIEEMQKLPELFEFEAYENIILTINRLKELKKVFVRPDAILSDVNLPGLSGFDFYNKIIADSFFSNVPFILYNKIEHPEYFKISIKNKVDDYYQGNFKITDLHTRIFYLKKYLSYSPKAGTDNYVSFSIKLPLSKRLFDIFTSSFAILILSPLLLVISVLIKLESKGPLIYKSKRVGSGYNIFYFYKFRSMRIHSDKKIKELENKNIYKVEDDFRICPDCQRLGYPCSPELYIHGEKICENIYLKRKKAKIDQTFKKFENDPRITIIGNFIRKTSIDELPQLFNVLKGDMSIVGNRPLPLYEAEMLTSDQWAERFLGPAGLTGLWQVMLKNTKDDTNFNRKMIDNYYAKNYSFWRDLLIIFKTIPVLIFQKNK